MLVNKENNMSNALSEVLNRAKTNVKEGARASYDAISDAFDAEIEKDWVCWELMKEFLNPVELLDGKVGDGVVSAYAQLFGYVLNEIEADVEDFIEENTWRVFYCNGPDEDAYEDCDELDNKDEFLEVVKYMADRGWKVIKQDEKRAYLYEEEDGE